MKKIAVILIAALLASTTTFAQETDTWRNVAAAVPLGSKVRVQTVTGKRVTGTLMRVDDKAITVKKNNRMPEPAVVVSYDVIANMERDHNGGMNWAKAIGFGVAAGAGAILTILAIALQLD
jgi:hypothetical protein